MNEVVQLAETLVAEDGEGDLNRRTDAFQSALKTLVHDLREHRSKSVVQRYDLAWRVLAKREIDCGSGTRQELEILRKIRNELVHMKSEQTETCVDNASPKPTGFNGIWLGRAVERYSHPKYLQSLQQESSSLMPRQRPLSPAPRASLAAGVRSARNEDMTRLWRRDILVATSVFERESSTRSTASAGLVLERKR